MSYPLPPYRRPRKAPAPPPRIPADLPDLVDEFRDRPFGSFGETTVHRPEPAPPPPGPPLVIEPPDWEAEAKLRREREPEPVEPEPRLPLEAAAQAMAGWDPPAPGPPAHVAPLIRPAIPEPDWRQEELDRVKKGAP